MAKRDFIASAIILAAGNSRRFGRDKQFFKISGRYVIELSIEKFIKIENLKEIVLVVSEKNYKRALNIFRNKKLKVVIGGNMRLNSLKNGFAALDKTEVVAVHDGARPFVSKNLIKNCLQAAFKYGSSVPVTPLKDTVKEVSRDMFIKKTIDRSKYFSVQTPQCYRYDLLNKILSSKYSENDLSDESQILEKFSIKPKAVLGEYSNIKITTIEDVYMAKSILGLN
jgi:2-C-methyl-D-erythritol 4-phosphate cytidylyltransferase